MAYHFTSVDAARAFGHADYRIRYILRGWNAVALLAYDQDWREVGIGKVDVSAVPPMASTFIAIVNELTIKKLTQGVCRRSTSLLMMKKQGHAHIPTEAHPASRKHIGRLR